MSSLLDLVFAMETRKYQKKQIFCLYNNSTWFSVSNYILRIYKLNFKQAKLSHLGHRKPARHALKSQRTQIDSLFGADFGPEAYLGHFFFENEQGETVTVNGDRYWAILNEFLFIKIVEENIGNNWFQQDWATCHTAEATRDDLKRLYISYQSCDLTPLDYYLLRAVKDKCYADRPETIDALKHNIREAINELKLHTINNVLKNWTAWPAQAVIWMNLFSIINRKDCTFK